MIEQIKPYFYFQKNNKQIFTPSKPLYILFTILRLQSMNIHRTAFGLVSLKNGHKYSTNILAIGGILIAGGGSAQDVNNIILFSSFPLKLKTKWINKTITKMQHQQKRRTKNQSTFPSFQSKSEVTFSFRFVLFFFQHKPKHLIVKRPADKGNLNFLKSGGQEIEFQEIEFQEIESFIFHEMQN